MAPREMTTPGERNVAFGKATYIRALSHAEQDGVPIDLGGFGRFC